MIVFTACCPDEKLWIRVIFFQFLHYHEHCIDSVKQRVLKITQNRVEDEKEDLNPFLLSQRCFPFWPNYFCSRLCLLYVYLVLRAQGWLVAARTLHSREFSREVIEMGKKAKVL